ncbi:hypothetical protein BLNAU_7717 [Blattamonas nauphoetae]|uniref:Uncharacterized protein n=1 Tax=Blattamonas nauphoetae TaxID=2049346 RepID=A0ABQ9Y0Z8_9EUKA|nr:hypothetical protein BLNAU_7717 [Blattamonas nauphoetae]
MEEEPEMADGIGTCRMSLTSSRRTQQMLSNPRPTPFESLTSLSKTEIEVVENDRDLSVSMTVQTPHLGL